MHYGLQLRFLHSQTPPYGLYTNLAETLHTRSGLTVTDGALLLSDTTISGVGRPDVAPDSPTRYADIHFESPDCQALLWHAKRPTPVPGDIRKYASAACFMSMAAFSGHGLESLAILSLAGGIAALLLPQSQITEVCIVGEDRDQCQETSHAVYNLLGSGAIMVR